MNDGSRIERIVQDGWFSDAIRETDNYAAVHVAGNDGAKDSAPDPCLRILLP
jgi:hypothetical protein